MILHMNILVRTLTILLFCLQISSVHAEERQQPKLGYVMTELPERKTAPDFTLVDLDGKKIGLKKYSGKVIMINFWATWCPPCRREMPSMERVTQLFKGKDFGVISVNQMEDVEQVFTFVAALDTYPSYPILLDKDSTVSRAFDVLGLPTTYIIDKKGKIRYRAIGGREFDHPDVEKLIQALLKE